MNRVFINEETKKSTIILTLILTLFISLQLWMYNDYIKKQKQDYIGIVGSIISKTVSVDPNLESEIISIVTQNISDKDKESGRDILKQYGITGKLSSSLFPNITDNYNVIILSLILSVLLIILNYTQYIYFFNKVRNLTLAANKILDDDYTHIINEDKEGDFSKLAVEFSNVRRIIRNNISTTHKEKQYLVELLQNISHQLKTKLATMILYNDILLNRKITEEQKVKFLKDNSVQLNNMNTMIQNILKLAKLDANTIEFNKKEENLNQTIREVICGFEEFANMKNVKLEINESEQIILQQDKFWLKESFNNIIKNCIEHTSKDGYVKIYLSDNAAYYRVTIKDSGEGIDQMDVPHIFNRFYKTKSSNRKDSVGIGLSISKSIIESHNGYIDVKSEKGVGSSFIVTFMKY